MSAPADPSAGAQDDLRAVYDQEVADRLPRLEAALAAWPEDTTIIARDAHALAGTGFVSGARPAALAARALECGLRDGGGTPALLTALVAELRQGCR